MIKQPILLVLTGCSIFLGGCSTTVVRDSFSLEAEKIVLEEKEALGGSHQYSLGLGNPFRKRGTEEMRAMAHRVAKEVMERKGIESVQNGEVVIKESGFPPFYYRSETLYEVKGKIEGSYQLPPSWPPREAQE